MSNSPPKRLTEVAGEFNISWMRIVEFLKQKGFAVQANPNARITAEMYEVISREFKGEKETKEKTLQKAPKAPVPKVISIEDQKKEIRNIEPEEEEEDLIITGIKIEMNDEFIKEIQSPLTKQKDIPIAKPEPHSKPPAQKIPPEVPQPVVEEVISEQSITEPLVKETIPQEVDQHKMEEVEAATVSPSVPEKPVVEIPEETPVVAQTESTPVAEIDTTVEGEISPIETREKTISLKIVGQIDLDTIQPKPRKKEKPEKPKITEKPKLEKPPVGKKGKPQPKTAASQPEPAEKAPVAIPEEPKQITPITQTEPPVTEKTRETPKAPEKEKPKYSTTEEIIASSEVFRPPVEKIAGPTILGKIELPSETKPEKPKPVATSKDFKQQESKRKRKRIAPTDVPKDEQEVFPKFPRDKNKIKERHQKPSGKGFIKEPKQELSQEEIDKQFRETLAKLTASGKGRKPGKARREEERRKIPEGLIQDQEAKILKVTEFVTANELATLMNVPVSEIISMCMDLGLMVTINQRLDAETITLIAEEFGYKVEFAVVDVALDKEEKEEDRPEDRVPRAPIVTVMGHVDHGKTKLLDYIRRTNVVAGEAGGITQHIGAYEVVLDDGRKITFLDTPGHEAFTAMRARGAKVTDIAIIVIAADDNVMPQTKEAINHALAAGVPIVFAINKIDKPTANPTRIKEQLSQMNILVEDWGGKYQSQEISAVTGQGVDQLLEKVLLEAELLDLKANPKLRATGTVIESALDKGRGYVAKLLVQNGTLKVGDVILAGAHAGKVRAMYNERNQRISQAGPSTPALVLGIDGAPQAGDTFKVMTDEREARSIAAKRQQLLREQGIRTQKHITLDEIGRRIAIGDFKELNIIVKGDVDGSVEALSDELMKLSTPQVQVNVIHKSVGQVTENDVMLASASNAIIVAFQVRPSPGARKLAEREQIDIRTYSIIYTAIDEIKSAIEGMLAPEIQEKITCNLEVRELFRIGKGAVAAGCLVLDGTVTRSSRVRIIRDGIVVYTGKIATLKRHKDDVREVSAGLECGVTIENFNDIKVGDIIEGFEEVKIPKKLEV